MPREKMAMRTGQFSYSKEPDTSQCICVFVKYTLKKSCLNTHRIQRASWHPVLKGSAERRESKELLKVCDFITWHHSTHSCDSRAEQHRGSMGHVWSVQAAHTEEHRFSRWIFLHSRSPGLCFYLHSKGRP